MTRTRTEMSNIPRRKAFKIVLLIYFINIVFIFNRNMDTLIHLLKGSLGTGILAMPNAFNHSGYIVGAVGTIVIGFICTYCIHLLIKAEYELCKRKKVISSNQLAQHRTQIISKLTYIA